MPFSAKKRHFNNGLCMSGIHLCHSRSHGDRASEGSSRGPSLTRRVSKGGHLGGITGGADDAQNARTKRRWRMPMEKRRS